MVVTVSLSIIYASCNLLLLFTFVNYTSNKPHPENSKSDFFSTTFEFYKSNLLAYDIARRIL
jgi:hypothetical protein